MASMHVISPARASRKLNGLRTSEVRHMVDDADANGDLGRPQSVRIA
ncbi:MAG: hypothetical protein V3Q69_06965 [Burkholderia sp.]